MNSSDRRFLRTIDRLKLYLLLVAGAVFCYLLFVPAKEIQMTTSVIGLALCAIFWLTQRLLSFITLLDVELTRVINVVKRILPEDQQKDLFR